MKANLRWAALHFYCSSVASRDFRGGGANVVFGALTSALINAIFTAELLADIFVGVALYE